MNFHKTRLDQLCRLCGKQIVPGGKKYNAMNQRSAILKLYKVDVAEDNSEIHPMYFCASCKYIVVDNLNKCQRKLNRIEILSATLQIKVYNKHSITAGSCLVCDTPAVEIIPGASGNPSPFKHSLERTDSDVVDNKKRRMGAFKKTNLDDSTEINYESELEPKSMKLFKFVDESAAKSVACAICQHVSFKPVITKCQHIFCEVCLLNVIQHKYSSKCWVCCQIFDIDGCHNYEQLDPSSQLGKIHASLEAKCGNESCDKSMPWTKILYHERQCKKTEKKETRGRNKGLIVDVKSQQARFYRVNETKSELETIAEEKDEESLDLLYSLLYNKLHNQNEEQRKVLYLWKSHFNREIPKHANKACGRPPMTPQEAVKLRCDNIMSQNQLDNITSSFRKMGFGDIMPTQVSTREAFWSKLPANVDFEIVSVQGLVLLQHPIPVVGDPSAFRQLSVVHAAASIPNINGLIRPQCVDSQFNICEAIAKDLQDLLDVNFVQTPVNGNMTVFVKYHSDGMDDLPRISSSGRPQGDHAVRAAFCIWRIVDTDSNQELYVCETPNSDRSNRTVLFARADEKDVSSYQLITERIEDGFVFLKNNILKLGGYLFKIVPEFIPDYLLLSASSGNAPPSSIFLCDQDDCSEQKPTKSLENTRRMSSMMEWNPSKIAPKVLYQEHSKGMVRTPYTQFDVHERCPDVLHKDLNLLKFEVGFMTKLRFYELYPHLAKTWNKPDNLSKEYDNVEVHVKRELQQQMKFDPIFNRNPGNNARKVMVVENSKKISKIIGFKEESDRRNYENHFQQMCNLRKLYRYQVPKKKDAEKRLGEKIPTKEEFQVKAKEASEASDFLFKTYDGTKNVKVPLRSSFTSTLTPSLHSVFSQLAPYIPYIGAKSGEGLEHGHKYGRKIAKDKSFKGSAQKQCDDTLFLQWVMSSP